jgi:enamine deaminase RidA (YjgF/YER057c/UK114 family)
MRMKDVVKITHFLTDAKNLPVYNEVRSKFLGEERPCSTLLIVAGLASPHFLIEVEMVAAITRR